MLFVFVSLLLNILNIYLKRINEAKRSLRHLDLDYHEKYLMYFVKRALHRRIFLKIDIIIKHMLY